MRYLVYIALLFGSVCVMAEGQLKSGGQYEANLRNVGIPISSGMTYSPK